LAQQRLKGQNICDRTRTYALRIIKLYQALEEHGAGQVIGKQLLRSGTSIGANVEEAQAGHSKPDFVFKLNIALKEARETRYWLTLIQDAELMPPKRLASILEETEEIIKIIYTIVQKNR